jgi:hypothetical protein
VGETISSIAPLAAAYSLRSLTGGDPKVVRVRRDTGGGAGDNDEEDFTVSGISSGALVDFVGSGNNGFVDTWYDQSGNGNHAINNTDAEQPKIVSSGSLIADGIDFDGSDDTLTAASVSGFGATISMFSASVRDSGGAAVLSMGSSASTDNTNFGIIEGASVSNVNARNTTSVTASASVSGVTRLTFGLTTGQTSTKSGALGGTLVENTSDYGSNFTSGELNTIFLGKLRAGSGSSFNGHIKEALIYTSDQSSNRDAIEANIANYYNITLV